MNARSLSLFASLLSLLAAPIAGAQIEAYFRVDIAAPVGTGAPVVTVQPFTHGSLADRTAIQHMWDGMAFQIEPVARECAMPVTVEIDAGSFAGHIVSGTDDGLAPGTRSRFRDLARAVTALCHRGGIERDAVRGGVRTVRFAYTPDAADQLTLSHGTLVFATNADMSGERHLGYSEMIDQLTRSL